MVAGVPARVTTEWRLQEPGIDGRSAFRECRWGNTAATQILRGTWALQANPASLDPLTEQLVIQQTEPVSHEDRYDIASVDSGSLSLVRTGRTVTFSAAKYKDFAGNDATAVHFYACDADLGHRDAQFKLGYLYMTGGGGLPKDERTAVSFYRLAADQGDSNAQVNLGSMHERGAGGLPKDEREAARLYTLAAGQGNPFGLNNLAWYYENGLGGLPKDDQQAAHFYQLAAAKGNAIAQYHLGVFYENGRGGLPRDLQQAIRFYKLAADQKEERAATALRQLQQ